MMHAHLQALVWFALGFSTGFSAGTVFVLAWRVR